MTKLDKGEIIEYRYKNLILKILQRFCCNKKFEELQSQCLYSNMLHVGDPVLDKCSFMRREQHLHHNLSDTIISLKEKKKDVREMSLGFPRYRGKPR